MFNADRVMPCLTPSFARAALLGSSVASHADGCSRLNILPGGGWRASPFWAPPPPGLPFSGAYVVIPSPPVNTVPFWSAVSCPLRLLRRHARWLDLCLQWTSIVLSLASLGRRCHLVLCLSSSFAVELHGWLLACCQTEPGLPAVSFRFTRLNSLALGTFVTDSWPRERKERKFNAEQRLAIVRTVLGVFANLCIHEFITLLLQSVSPVVQAEAC